MTFIPLGSKIPVRNTKSSSNLPWQSHTPIVTDSIEFKSSDEILKKISYSVSDHMQHPKEDERIEDYKNLFGESTVEDNMQYLSQQLLRKSKNRELAQQQEEHKNEKEKSKKGRRTQSHAIRSTSTKPPIYTKVGESLSVSKTFTDVESNPIKVETSPISVNLHISKTNTLDLLVTEGPKTPLLDQQSLKNIENEKSCQPSSNQSPEHSSMIKVTNFNETESLQAEKNMSRNEDEVVIDIQRIGSSKKKKSPALKREFLGVVGDFINYFESAESRASLAKEEDEIYTLSVETVNENLLLQKKLDDCLAENRQLQEQNQLLQEQVDDFAGKISEFQNANEELTNKLFESCEIIEQLKQVIAHLLYNGLLSI